MQKPIQRVLMLLENNPYPQDIRVRREANSLVQAGYTVTVISPRQEGQTWQEKVEGVHVYRFPAPPEGTGFLGYFWEYGYAMAAIFVLSLWVWLRRGFDVVHIHNPPDMVAIIAALYKVVGKQVVFDHHDLAPEMYGSLFGKTDGLVYQALLGFEHFACRVADHIIVTNQSYQELDMSRHQIPAERITIVRNGPEPSHFTPTAPDPALRQPGKTTLCYVGSMGFHDGLDYLLRALHHLVYDLKRTDFWCVLVGGGAAYPGMLALGEELGLGKYVHFTGKVPHEQVARYLNAADICLAPEPADAYNSRSTMIKILEYMAAGKPIVAFDLVEHRFSAREAAAYAVPNQELSFAQQIAQLMDAPAQRASMGLAGRTRIERELAWHYQAQQLLTAYAALRARPAFRYVDQGMKT